MKVWEIHGLRVGGAIRTTPDGDADVDGLVFSEKAYFLVMRDLRPEQLLDLVQRDGILEAAHTLVERYSRPDALHSSGGRGLVLTRSRIGGTGLIRADEQEVRLPAGRRS